MNTRPSFSPGLLVLLGFSFLSTSALRAADVTPPTADAPADYTAQLSADQLDDLLGPIALYPDALIALILPASTSPTEVVLAARFINAKTDPSQIDAQPWSDSVKALTRYPDVILWMDTNLQWTKEVGDAFIAQPAEMMNSVQHLRSIAKSNGALVTTPQQRVIVEDQAIEIIPAEPDVIYVPRYDPEVVFIDRPYGYYSGPFITFGSAFAAGIWLNYDFDWRRRTIWVGDYRHDWREHRDWRARQPIGASYPANPNWHAWHPPANRPTPPRDLHRPPAVVVHPRPFPGTPNIPRPPRPPHPGDVNPPQHQQGSSRPTRPDQSYHRSDQPAETPALLNRATPLAPARATPIEPSRATPAPVDRPVVNPTPTPHRPPQNRVVNPPPGDRRPPPVERAIVPPPASVERRAEPPSQRVVNPMPMPPQDRHVVNPPPPVQVRNAPPPPAPKAPPERVRDRDPKDKEN